MGVEIGTRLKDNRVHRRGDVKLKVIREAENLRDKLLQTVMPSTVNLPLEPDEAGTWEEGGEVIIKAEYHPPESNGG